MIELTPRYGDALEKAGPCFSAFAGESVIACAGVLEIWPGRAQVWSLLSEDVGMYGFRVHLAVKRFLNAYRCRRLECVIDPRSARAIAWATALGFRREGFMEAYTPNGDDQDLYVRLTR